MFFLRLKTFISAFAAIALCFALGLGVYAMNVCKLHAVDGARVFYLDSRSSQGLRKETLSLRDLPRIEGESVRFDLEETEEETLAWIIEEYGARVVFCEEACGVTSYYCYTDEWAEGLWINGRKINLHIAFSNGQCVMGTPIIFDGY